jgi:hypothetical protein
MTALLLLVLAVVVPAVVTVGAMVGVARTRARPDGELDADSLGFVGGTLNAIYIVILAFYVVFAWQTGDDISAHADTEANALIDIHHQAGEAPAAQRDEIRRLVSSYATEVVEREWGMLADGRTDDKVDEIVADLRAAVSAMPTDAEDVTTARSFALTDVRTLDEFHRDRVDDSTGSGIFNTTLLVGTVVGSVLMIVFPLLMGLTATVRHLLVMGMMAVILGVMVYMSFALIDPLNGVFAQEPEAFESALEIFTGGSGTPAAG